MARSPHNGLIGAFQRLEKRIHREELNRIEEARTKKRTEVLKRLEKQYRKRKLVERTAFGITLVFSVVIIVIVYLSKPDLFKSSSQLQLNRGKGVGINIDCKDKKNQKLPVCRHKNIKIHSQNSWSGNSLDFQGDGSPFTLYNPDKKN